MLNFRYCRLPLFLALAHSTGVTQVVPGSAHVVLYFPNFIDGGPSTGQFQTKLNFVNPNNVPSSVRLNFFGDDGSPVRLNFGSGLSTSLSFTIPSFGKRVFRSSGGSSTILAGWINGSATAPVQANITFRSIQNGVASAEIGVNSTLPTPLYISSATTSSNIALANQYTDIPVTIGVALVDSQGQSVAQQNVVLPPLGHRFFSVSQLFSGLTPAFSGSVILSGPTPAQAPPQLFVAWTLDAEQGSFSPVPDGKAGFPISQWDRVWLVFQRVLAGVSSFADLGTSPVNLTISPDPVVNAFGARDAIQINLALAEVISDSESELAFVIAHELGHVYQRRSARFFFYPPDPEFVEFDADAFGTIAALAAGFDPYGAAGALAKLALATGTAGLTTQFEDQLSGDAHKSFNSRLELLYDILSGACGFSPQIQAACATYKFIFHPHLPTTAPLADSNK